MPDIETAQEMVKVYTFTPVKIKDSEVKMIHMKQRIGLNTPVQFFFNKPYSVLKSHVKQTHAKKLAILYIIVLIEQHWKGESTTSMICLFFA